MPTNVQMYGGPSGSSTTPFLRRGLTETQVQWAKRLLFRTHLCLRSGQTRFVAIVIARRLQFLFDLQQRGITGSSAGRVTSNRNASCGLPSSGSCSVQVVIFARGRSRMDCDEAQHSVL
jgi:hypothetical protein